MNVSCVGDHAGFSVKVRLISMEEFEVRSGRRVSVSHEGSGSSGARGGMELSRPNLLGDQLRRLPMVLPLPAVT
jgi:hypothetical protein